MVRAPTMENDIAFDPIKHLGEYISYYIDQLGVVDFAVMIDGEWESGEPYVDTLPPAASTSASNAALSAVVQRRRRASTVASPTCPPSSGPLQKESPWQSFRSFVTGARQPKPDAYGQNTRCPVDSPYAVDTVLALKPVAASSPNPAADGSVMQGKANPLHRPWSSTNESAPHAPWYCGTCQTCL